MNFKTRNDGASTRAAGQAQPLPLLREGEGRAAPLPTPRAGDGRATPLPVVPRVDDAPGEADPPSPAAHETYSITKPALDYYYDRAKGHFARFNNMSVAFKLAGRDLKTRIVKTGRVFDLKPPTAFESFLESHALRTRSGAPQEAPDVAARRRDWDEAKRAGNAGAMTATANALVRAVEEARGHLGAHAAGEDARHPTSEILDPRVPEASVSENALGEHIHGEEPTLEGIDPFVLPADRRVSQPDANKPSGATAGVFGEASNQSAGYVDGDPAKQQNGSVPLGWWPDRLSRGKPKESSNRLRVKLVGNSITKGGRIRSQRNFELDQASRRGGHVVQEVTIIFRPRMPDGSFGPARVLYHFWEAWEIKPGQKSPWERIGATNDSVRFERGPGGGGRVEILTRTIFYEGLRSLPSQFKRNKPVGQPGHDPSIDPAGELQATSRPFELPPDSYEFGTPADQNAIYTDW